MATCGNVLLVCFQAGEPLIIILNNSMTSSGKETGSAILMQLLLSRMESLEHSIKEIERKVVPTGKTWLNPTKFATQIGVTPQTLRMWLSKGLFSDRAHRVQTTSGGRKVNQFHSVIAPQELEAGQ